MMKVCMQPVDLHWFVSTVWETNQIRIWPLRFHAVRSESGHSKPTQHCSIWARSRHSLRVVPRSAKRDEVGFLCICTNGGLRWTVQKRSCL